MKLLGFRSGTLWKKILAVLYYGLCATVLFFAITTPPPVVAGTQDVFIYKISAIVIVVWMISPAIFLSKSLFRSKLPLFKQYKGIKSLIGMMIISIIFVYLFASIDNFHTPEYKALSDSYYTALYGGPFAP